MTTPLVRQAAEIMSRGDQPIIADYVELYQQHQVDQILLPEETQCLAVKTFLHMCNVKFHLKMRSNAEQMSPSGGLPFIKMGPQIISEFEPIVDHLSLKGVNLSRELSGSQRALLKAYMSLTVNRLYLAELYVTWRDKLTAEEITKVRYGSPYSWPLNKILPWLKQREVETYLQAQGWYDKTINQVYTEVDLCCKALSDKLEDQYYFFMDRPTELDALVFAHLHNLLNTELTSAKLADIVRKHDNLMQFCERIRERYFPDGGNEEDS
ncbi:metaxin-2-like [Acanthaster planci]|uniref:Metaxin-2-like n=1 Tax=Acanthaster planci TaxID=133434 RepID=A0A8B7XXD9_ACAPL|nr:metaxin-2-like [Acanthaster planci]